MDALPPRLRALADCRVAFLREYSGLHEYDGVVQDLSPGGVGRALSALGGERFSDSLDEQTVAAAESAARVRLGVLENARRDPSLHLEGLDLACYERDYAPLADRLAARSSHLAQWPDAIAAAIGSLDMVPKEAAQALLPSARGLALSVRPDDGPLGEAALSALDRLVGHLERLAAEGPASAALGEARLLLLITCADGISVDLARLMGRVAQERGRLLAMLEDACGRLGLGRPDAPVIHQLLARHGDFEETLGTAGEIVGEAARFAAERQLIPFTEGECLVAPTPPARRWATARISWVAPREPLAPAFFHITPPDEGWDEATRASWLARFSLVTLPVMTVHEAVPGHASQAIAMRHVASLPRQILWSELFFEGWAHYVEELCWEEGFRSHDAEFQAGVAIEGLIRLARVECAIGLHTDQLTVAEATQLLTEHAFLEGAAARGEALRGLFEPTYTRYAMGKFLVQDLRLAARQQWGADFSLPRFHRELLGLGSPPFGAAAPALGLTAVASGGEWSPA